MNKIFNQIRHEREQQDAQWGGWKHDDTHDIRDWSDYIGKQNHALWNSQYANDTKQARERLIKIAALAVAVIESLDRQAAKSEAA